MFTNRSVTFFLKIFASQYTCDMIVGTALFAKTTVVVVVSRFYVVERFLFCFFSLPPPFFGFQLVLVASRVRAQWCRIVNSEVRAMSKPRIISRRYVHCTIIYNILWRKFSSFHSAAAAVFLRWRAYNTRSYETCTYRELSSRKSAKNRVVICVVKSSYKS